MATAPDKDTGKKGGLFGGGPSVQTLIIDPDSGSGPAQPAGFRHPLTPISGSDFHAPRRRALPPLATLLIVVSALGALLLIGIKVSAAIDGFFFDYPWLSPLLLWGSVAGGALVSVNLVRALIDRLRGWGWAGRVERSRFGVPFDRGTAIGVGFGGLLLRAVLARAAGVPVEQLTTLVFGPGQLELEAPHLAYQTERIAAEKYPVVSTVTEGSSSEVSTMLEAPELPGPELPALPPGQSELAALMDQGLICRSGRSTLVGFAGAGHEQPQYLDPALAPVVAYAGASQSGKSSAARFELAQLAMQPSVEPVGIVLCDPHGRVAERSLAVSCAPLTPSWLWEPAVDVDTIMVSVRKAAQILQARIDGRDPARWLLVLVIDEFTALMNQHADVRDPLIRLCQDVTMQYAKVGGQLRLLGQAWNADLAGGTALRTQIQATIVTACKKEQARFLLSTDEAAQAEQLRPQSGDALFKPHWSEPLIKVRVPFVRQEDIAAMADHIRRAPAVGAPPPGPLAGQIIYPKGITSQKGKIAHLLLQGWSYRQVEKELAVSHGTIRKVRLGLEARGVKIAADDALGK